MRAGTLDREIVIETPTETVDDYGNPQSEWTAIGIMRAQLIEASTDEFMRNYGAASEHVVVFRTRYVLEVTVGCRVHYGWHHFIIKQVKEIGRRRGLELRCERTGA